MKKLLWLDDVRNPFVMSAWLLQWSPEYHYEKDNGTHEVIWVKDYGEFVDWIQENGLPTEIGFDHDLADVVYSNRGNIDMLKSTWKEKTGMDAAKWLVEYCMDNMVNVPNYFIQSANPVGASNISAYLENAKKHI